MTAFITSFFFVALAEFGDKTQLLAMAFVSQYSAYKVLIAIFLATLINHALAVFTGHFLTTVIPQDIISFVAALSFIGFGLWTIRGEELESPDKKKSRFGPMITVGIAFFLAEMGDKTQLATVSLAVEYRNMLCVLIGTTLGMVTADGFGIIFGILMRKHIPEKTIKLISAVIFILFGLSAAYKVLSNKISAYNLWCVILLMSTLTIYASYRLWRREKR